MKRIIVSILALAIALVLIIPNVALASDVSGADFSAIVRVTNNSTAATIVSVPVDGCNTTSLINGGYMNATATDTAIQSDAGADIPFSYVSDTEKMLVFVESITSDSIYDYTWYNNSTGGDMVYFPGDDGMNVVDDATLEISDNGSVYTHAYLSDSGNISSKGYAATCSYDAASDEIDARLAVSTNTTLTEYATGNDIDIQVYGGLWRSQSFTLESGALVQSVALSIFDGGGVPEEVYLSIRDSVANVPAGDNYTTTHINVNGLAEAFYAFDVPDVYLAAGTYCLEVYSPASDAANYPRWSADQTAPSYSGGQWGASTDSGVTWSTDATTDFYFRIYGADSVLIAASGMTADEYEIEYGNGLAVTDIMDMSDVASIGASMGQGMIPCVLLEEIELTGAMSSITFDDIADQVAKYEAITGETARHLVVYMNAASPDATALRQVRMRFNEDSTALYNVQTLYGQSNSSGATRITAATYAPFYGIPGTTYANSFGGGTLLIPHAFNTTNHKAFIYYGGAVEEATEAFAGRYASANAVSSIMLYPQTGTFAIGSVFQLCVVDERYLVEEATPVGDNVTFSGIAGTGNNLVVIGYTRSNRAATNDEIKIGFNGDAVAANYARQYISGANAAALANSAASNTIGVTPGDTATANAYGALITFISEYAETTNDPAYLVLEGYHESSTPQAYTYVVSGRRNNVAAITSVEYNIDAGSGFVDGTLFSLYRVPQYTIERYELTDNNTHTVTFSNIPQTYEALQLNIYARTTAAATEDKLDISLNGDVVIANYDRQYLQGAGAVVSAGRSGGALGQVKCTGDTAGANEFGAGIATIYRYAATDRHKHMIALSGVVEDVIYLTSNRRENTDNVSIIAVYPDGAADNLTAGTIIELVGTIPNHVYYLDVDSVRYGQYNQNSDNISMPDIPVDWTFGDGDVTSYIRSMSVTVGGAVTGEWEWEFDDEFTDLSGYGNTGTPTFRGATSDAGVSAEFISFRPISEALAPAYSVGAAPDFVSSNITASGNFTTGDVIPGHTGVGPPGSDIVDSGATAAGVVNIWIWGILGMCVLVAGGLGISALERFYGSGAGSIFLRLGWGCLVIGVMVTFGIYDWWMVVMYLFIALAPALASRAGDINPSHGQLNLIGFLTMAWVGLTTINRIQEGVLITADETSHLNTLMFTQEFELLNVFHIPIMNFEFFSQGIPSLLRWDYTFFGGNAQIIQYFMYSLTAIVSFIVLGLVIYTVSSYFTRAT